MRVAAFDALVLDRNDLARLGVVAEAGRVRHADELVLDDRLVERQRLRNDGFESRLVGPVRDDQIFAVDEAIGSGRKRRARQRHREGALAARRRFSCVTSWMMGVELLREVEHRHTLFRPLPIFPGRLAERALDVVAPVPPVLVDGKARKFVVVGLRGVGAHAGE